MHCFQEGLQQPDVLALNCTSLTNTADIFTKVPILMLNSSHSMYMYSQSIVTRRFVQVANHKRKSEVQLHL